jgi:DNA polymerase-3 subunit alpha
MPFVSSLEKKKRLRFQSKAQKIKKVLVDTDFVHLHNHTQFSVLQSTISIPQLVKAASKENACSCMTDHANLMGFSLCS